jgi:hypothetical protein
MNTDMDPTKKAGGISHYLSSFIGKKSTSKEIPEWIGEGGSEFKMPEEVGDPKTTLEKVKDGLAKGCSWLGMGVGGIGKSVGGLAMAISAGAEGLGALAGGGLASGVSHLTGQGTVKAAENLEKGAKVAGLTTAFAVSTLLLPVTLTAKCVEGMGKILKKADDQENLPAVYKKFDDSLKTSIFAAFSTIKLNNQDEAGKGSRIGDHIYAKFSEVKDVIKNAKENGAKTQLEEKREDLIQDSDLMEGDGARSEPEEGDVDVAASRSGEASRSKDQVNEGPVKENKRPLPITPTTTSQQQGQQPIATSTITPVSQTSQTQISEKINSLNTPLAEIKKQSEILRKFITNFPKLQRDILPAYMGAKIPSVISELGKNIQTFYDTQWELDVKDVETQEYKDILDECKNQLGFIKENFLELNRKLGGSDLKITPEEYKGNVLEAIIGDRLV